MPGLERPRFVPAALECVGHTIGGSFGRERRCETVLRAGLVSTSPGECADIRDTHDRLSTLPASRRTRGARDLRRSTEGRRNRARYRQGGHRERFCTRASAHRQDEPDREHRVTAVHEGIKLHLVAIRHRHLGSPVRVVRETVTSVAMSVRARLCPACAALVGGPKAGP